MGGKEKKDIQQIIKMMVHKLKYDNIKFEDTIFVCNKNDMIENDNENAKGIDINVKIRHTICEKFVNLFIEAAKENDATSVGTAQILKCSLSKVGKQYFPDIDGTVELMNMIDEINITVHDQKKTETDGFVQMKEATQSEEYKCVYNIENEAKCIYVFQNKRFYNSRFYNNRFIE